MISATHHFTATFRLLCKTTRQSVGYTYTRRWESWCVCRWWLCYWQCKCSCRNEIAWRCR